MVTLILRLRHRDEVRDEVRGEHRDDDVERLSRSTDDLVTIADERIEFLDGFVPAMRDMADREESGRAEGRMPSAPIWAGSDCREEIPRGRT